MVCACRHSIRGDWIRNVCNYCHGHREHTPKYHLEACLNVSSRAWSQPGRMTTRTSIMLLNAIGFVAYSPIGVIPPSLSGHHRQYSGTMHFVDVGVVVCLHDVDTHLILFRSS